MGKKIPHEISELIPKAGFIRDYVEYASRCTDAPMIYHIGCAVTVVSVAISDTTHLIFEKGTKIPLNLWTMVAGRSSLDRKSTSVGLAADIVREAMPHKIAPSSGSAEGLMEFLADQPCAIFVVPELAALLDQMEASYWKQGRSLLMDLYDGRGSYTRKLKGHEPITISNPRISMLAASAIALLDQTARATDWSGGFLARFMTVYAERVEFQPSRRDNAVERDRLIDELCDLASSSRAEIKATEDAKRAHRRFSSTLDEIAQGSRDYLHGPICRLSDHVQRVAAIYAATTGSDLGWHHMMQAINLGRLLMGSITTIGDKISRDPAFRERARVLTILRDHPEGVWLRDILRWGPFLKHRLDPIISSLVAEEMINIEVWDKKQLVILNRFRTRRRRNLQGDKLKHIEAAGVISDDDPDDGSIVSLGKIN